MNTSCPDDFEDDFTLSNQRHLLITQLNGELAALEVKLLGLTRERDFLRARLCQLQERSTSGVQRPTEERRCLCHQSR